jgi:hypothetical protein
MPDNDIVPRSTRRRWRKATLFLIGGHESATIGHAVDRALTETVKAARLPSPHALVQAIRDADLASDTAAFETALEKYKYEAGDFDIGHDVVAEARALYELRRADLHAQPEEAITLGLVSGALRRHATRALLGSEKVSDAMIATGLPLPEIADRQRAGLDAAQYDAIAKQVVGDQADQARTPPSQVVRPDIADLLAEEI